MPGSGQGVGAGGTLFHCEEEQGRQLSTPFQLQAGPGCADEAPDAGSECQGEGSPKDTHGGWVLTWPRVSTHCSLMGDLRQGNHVSVLPTQLVDGSACLIQTLERVKERKAQGAGRDQAWSLLFLV